MNRSNFNWGSGPRLLLAAFLMNCLASCAVGPDYKQPTVPMSAHWRSSTEFQQAQPDDDKIRGNWWEMFGDAQLNQLEAQALEHNQNWVAAAEHLNQARLQVDATASIQLPAVDAVASDARTKTSADHPFGAYSGNNVSFVQNNPQLGMAVSYEADLFGRVRRLVESASALAEQADADFENTQLLLTSDLASNYVNLCESDQEINILEHSVILQEKSVDFIRIRHDLNYATGLDLAQQQALLESNQAQLALLQRQRAALQYAIATLIGVPAPDVKLVTPIKPLTMPTMPVALPSELLQRRPDVASAERAVAAANANIGLAKAAYYPSIMLQAGDGWSSAQWSNLISAPSILWSLGATVTEHIFDNGKNAAYEKIAESLYTSAVAKYRQSVLVAMQEVQTGVDSMVWLTTANTKAQSSVVSAEKAFSIANDRYKGGLDIYLNVIAAQQTLLANQRQAAQIEGQQMLNAVYLVKALGGGWQGLGK